MWYSATIEGKGFRKKKVKRRKKKRKFSHAAAMWGCELVCGDAAGTKDIWHL